MKIKITCEDGTVHIGYVHGNGGIMQDNRTLWRLKREQERMIAGEEPGIYIPKPGCIQMHSSLGNDDVKTIVPFVGSKFEMTF